jgi:hypothetical protein
MVAKDKMVNEKAEERQRAMKGKLLLGSLILLISSILTLGFDANNQTDSVSEEQAARDEAVKFYCANASVLRSCQTFTIGVDDTSVTFQVLNHADQGETCHLVIPSNVPDRPPSQVTAFEAIQSFDSTPHTFRNRAGDASAKFAAGTQLILQCKRGSARPGSDAGIGGFLYFL